MSRIRTIKPEFWASPDIVRLSLPARLLFIGLWNFADDAGILPADPLRSKLEVFPGDAFTVEEVSAWLSELTEGGLLLYYEVEGRAFWKVTGWRHQRVDRPNLRYPDCPENGNSTSTRRAFDEPSRPKRVRVEYESSTSRVESSRVESSLVESKTTSSNERRRRLGKVRIQDIRDLAANVRSQLRRAGRWRENLDMQRLVVHAATLVVCGDFPPMWLSDGVDAVIAAAEVKKPSGLLAERLTKFAAEQGKDFDALRRGLKIPDELMPTVKPKAASDDDVAMPTPAQRLAAARRKDKA